MAEVAETSPPFRHKRHFRHAANYECSIDFQEEKILESISADFLRK